MAPGKHVRHRPWGKIITIALVAAAVLSFAGFIIAHAIELQKAGGYHPAVPPSSSAPTALPAATAPPTTSPPASVPSRTARPAPAPAVTVTVTPTANSYVVQSGDTLEAISQYLYGTPADWMIIYRANLAMLTQSHGYIYPGEVLSIPILH